MKWFYVKSKRNVEESIITITSLFVLVIAIVINTKSPINQSNNTYMFLSLEWFESLLGIFIFEIFLLYCKHLISKQKKNFKKWQLFLTTNGIKCNGYVKEIRYIKNNNFEFKVSYFSELYKKDISFWTPIVNVKSINNMEKILCDVFEFNEQYNIINYDSELIKVNEEKQEVQFNLNPIKLFNTIYKKYTNIDWFDNKIAVNFRIKKDG